MSRSRSPVYAIIDTSAGMLGSSAALMHTSLPVLVGLDPLRRFRSLISPRSQSTVLTVPLQHFRDRLPTGQHLSQAS